MNYSEFFGSLIQNLEEQSIFDIVDKKGPMEFSGDCYALKYDHLFFSMVAPHAGEAFHFPTFGTRMFHWHCPKTETKTLENLNSSVKQQDFRASATKLYLHISYRISHHV